MSIADGWRHLGVGSALLEEIESKAAADGIEWLFGDTLRTNEGMIALARSHGFRLGPGLDGHARAEDRSRSHLSRVQPRPRGGGADRRGHLTDVSGHLEWAVRVPDRLRVRERL